MNCQYLFSFKSWQTVHMNGQDLLSLKHTNKFKMSFAAVVIGALRFNRSLWENISFPTAMGLLHGIGNLHWFLPTLGIG